MPRSLAALRPALLAAFPAALVAASAAPAAFAQSATLRPTEDGAVYNAFGSGIVTVNSVTGQQFPEVQSIPSPGQEQQVIFEYDLTPFAGQQFASAVLYFFVGRASAYQSVRIDTRYYAGNGVVDPSDFNAGSALVGTVAFDGPPGVFPGVGVNQFFTFDVTSVLNARAGNFAGFNLRLAGTAPNYDGNVFDPNNPFRFVGIASDENQDANGTLRPFLQITAAPEPSAMLLSATGLLGLAGLSVARRRRS